MPLQMLKVKDSLKLFIIFYPCAINSEATEIANLGRQNLWLPTKGRQYLWLPLNKSCSEEATEIANLS